MIKHIVLFRVKENLSDDFNKRFFSEFRSLSGLACVHSFTYCKELCSKEYNYAAMFEFSSDDSLAKFNTSPEHNEFLANYWNDVVSDYEIYDLLPCNDILTV